MKIIALFIRSSFWKFILAALSGVASGASLTGVILMINQAIETEMGDSEKLIIQFIGLLIAYVITSVISAYMITYISQVAVRDMRVSLSKKILHASFHKLEYQSKRLFTILTDDINTISGLVNRLPTLITGIATVLGCFIYMAMISLNLFLVFIVIFLLAFLMYRLPLNSYNERLRISRNFQNILFGHFEGLIYGLKELSLNRKLRSIYSDDIIKPVCEEQKKQNILGQTAVEAFSRWGEVILLLGIGAILVIIKKYGITDYSVLVQFLTVTLFTITPLSKITGYLPQLRRIDVAMEQIEAAGLDMNTEVEKEVSNNLVINDEKIIVSLKDVTYNYYHSDEEKFFKLGPVSLDIKRGEVVYLIGGNGSGKSTLAKILCGLYPPESGKVFYHGNEISEINVRDFRDIFGAIFADFYLFDQLQHLPMENLETKAREYLKLLELEKKVKIENNQISTTQLSTGQRKRLALLISYLEDKPFYLFDEWAAGLDPYYKKVFYTKLIPEMKKQGKTVFVITHDETYFNQADRVVMLKDGKLLDSHLLHDQLAEFFN